MRASTRLQLLSVTGLPSAPRGELEAALAEPYHEQPMRWQAFMDDATVQLGAFSSERDSGFAETVIPIE
ncbi:MAG: hypothetical protein ABI330_04830 [Caldimonas sp.]